MLVAVAPVNRSSQRDRVLPAGAVLTQRAAPEVSVPVILRVDQGVDRPSVGRIGRIEPLVVVEARRVWVVIRAENHRTVASQVVELRADPATSPVMTREELNAILCVPESAGRRVGDVLELARVTAPVEDDGLFPGHDERGLALRPAGEEPHRRGRDEQRERCDQGAVYKAHSAHRRSLGRGRPLVNGRPAVPSVEFGDAR
jgi:hypothetical protein